MRRRKRMDKQERKKVISVCFNCKHCCFIEEEDDWACGAPNAAITCFVTGLSFCHDMNEDGSCTLFDRNDDCDCCSDRGRMTEEEILKLADEQGIN
jgi:hypothetical protein